MIRKDALTYSGTPRAEHDDPQRTNESTYSQLRDPVAIPNRLGKPPTLGQVLDYKPAPRKPASSKSSQTKKSEPSHDTRSDKDTHARKLDESYKRDAELSKAHRKGEKHPLIEDEREKNKQHKK